MRDWIRRGASLGISVRGVNIGQPMPLFPFDEGISGGCWLREDDSEATVHGGGICFDRGTPELTVNWLAHDRLVLASCMLSAWYWWDVGPCRHDELPAPYQCSHTLCCSLLMHDALTRVNVSCDSTR